MWKRKRETKKNTMTKRNREREREREREGGRGRVCVLKRKKVKNNLLNSELAKDMNCLLCVKVDKECNNILNLSSDDG